MIKPKKPIGVLNKRFYDKFQLDEIELVGGMSELLLGKNRLANLRGAIMRYSEAGENIPIEWVEEYNSLSPPVKQFRL